MSSMFERVKVVAVAVVRGYVQCNWIFVCVRPVDRCTGVLSLCAGVLIPAIGQDVDDIVTARTSSKFLWTSLLLMD